ncbi:MAG: hypothetical protein ACLPTF_11835 [Steroidobacteraceae bacterium]
MSNPASFLDLRSRTLMLGILLIVLGATTVAVRSGEAFRYDDELRYHDLANSILHKHAYATQSGNPTAWWPPGYPILLSAAYAVLDRPMAAKILNVVCLTLAVFAAALLARRQNHNGMLISPYIALCYPILFYTASCLYPQSVGCLLLIVVVGLISSESLTRAGSVLAGILYGALCLTIPAFLMLLPLCAAFIVISGRNDSKRSLIKACIFAVGTVIVLVPWTARNFVQFHAFVPVSTNSGFNLVLGNSALTRPERTPDFTLLCPEASNPSGEVDFDHRLTRCATTWMRNNPMQAAELYAGKVLNYFNYRNTFQTKTETSKWANWIMFAGYYPLLLLAIARLAFVRRYPLNRTEILCYLLYFGNAFASALFFTRLRFRIPFDLLLIVIDAAFLAWLVDSLRRMRSTAATTAAST